MKKIPLILVGSSIAASLAFTATNLIKLQEPQAPQPTQYHQMLLQNVGTYQGEISMLGEFEGQKTAAYETVEAHGPFWTKSHFRMQMGPDVWYEGHGCLGYDPDKQEFVGTWIDNMQPTLSLMKGSLDEESGILTMNWKATTPESPDQPVPHRYEAKFEKGSYWMSFFVNGENTWRIDMQRQTSEAMDAPDHDHDHGHDEHGHGQDHSPKDH